MKKAALIFASVVSTLAISCSGATGATATGGDSGAATTSGGDDASTSTGTDGGGGTDSSSGGGSDSSSSTDGSAAETSSGHAIKTVFLIMMENHDWSAIKGSASAPYINKTLLPMAAYAENYKSPAGNHPSEPNYLWLEAGGSFGITNDSPPSANHQSTTDHLVTQLERAGVSWKSYQEDIDGTTCPLDDGGLYAVRHNPAVFFDDVNGGLNPNSKRCIDHVRPHTEFLDDLKTGKVAQYNFVTPNLCHDMHGQTIGTSCFAALTDMVAAGDTWLSMEIPAIMASDAYKHGGAIFVIWDEGTASLIGGSDDGPMGCIVVSSLAKIGPNSTAFTHSSTLKTIEEIFSVPLLRGAGDPGTKDLSEMFTSFP